MWPAAPPGWHAHALPAARVLASCWQSKSGLLLLLLCLAWLRLLVGFDIIFTALAVMLIDTVLIG